MTGILSSHSSSLTDSFQVIKNSIKMIQQTNRKELINTQFLPPDFSILFHNLVQNFDS